MAVGQGGPYQINDYSKRLPPGVEGALGLINYDSIRKSLGFTIAEQDNLAQTGKRGPAPLDNMYMAPMFAAFYHFNDINRMNTLYSEDSYKDPNAGHPQWGFFKAANLDQGGAPYAVNIAMNVIYNAGPYSLDAGTILNNLAAATDSIGNEMRLSTFDVLNDYSANPTDYQDSLIFSGGMNGSLTSPNLGDATYFRYPRQVNFYLDQLYNDNASLTAHSSNLIVDNEVKFVLTDVQDVFVRTMAQMGYKDVSSDNPEATILISEQQAESAFTSAISTTGASGDLYLSHDSDGANDRTLIIELMNLAISNLESDIPDLSFNAFTAKGVPPPLPDLSSNDLYSTTCGEGNFTNDSSEAASYAILKVTGGCAVYSCMQPNWCNNSCESSNPYNLPSGVAVASAWTGPITPTPSPLPAACSD